MLPTAPMVLCQARAAPGASCVREARIQDAWQIADTHCSSFLPHQGAVMDFALRLDRTMALAGSLPFEHKKYLVAVEETLGGVQVVSGILTIDKVGDFLPRRRPSGCRRTGIAYVSNVAVRHEFRRRGIAKRLLTQSEQVARGWGCRSIALHCDACNGAAVALYKSQGYRRVPVPLNAKWPQPKAVASSTLLLMIKLLIKHPVPSHHSSNG
ncbi:uncharacterized protein LOC9650399 isoform X2 [Selaginella moellendorffii]|uniref:uncharacterized protein LOC9650399 isoform X2 n=1 Tax=Selaginella moellendorffii TaxID=88036 RepID=UPI000D1CA8B1|nr:uncharacterized protein LOC9650399 isoform X2 [Selaginella moellendorffii]|eukprot:XP_024533302.1 uncharacterized protein LOC9650399 isoform X2 [Selaginella moellendorffii]